MRSEERLKVIREVCVKGGMSTGQKRGLLLLAGIILTGLAFAPIITIATLVAILIMISFAVLVFKIVIACNCKKGFAYIPDKLLSDLYCPKYTILVALRGEGTVVRQLVRNLCDLDYPDYEVLLCVDEDDVATCQAIGQMVREHLLPIKKKFRVVVCKNTFLPSLRSKPRALQYAVITGQIHGEYVVVYDAEDRPDRDQLRKAATAFAYLPKEVACLQAILVWYNAARNRYTQLLAGAYAYHFTNVTPGLCALNAVVPLGGTSNHFRVSALEDVGYWDPYNVTEDLALGVSLRRAGYRVMVLDSETGEEATDNFKAQVKQQSRWTKGHIATAISHMRNPWQLFKDLGVWGTISFLLVVFVHDPAALTGPLFWATTLVYFSTHANIIREVTPTLSFYTGCFCLASNLLFIFFFMVACLRTQQWKTALYMPLLPLYWITVSFGAAVKATWEVMRGELYKWDKTYHKGESEVYYLENTTTHQTLRQSTGNS